MEKLPLHSKEAEPGHVPTLGSSQGRVRPSRTTLLRRSLIAICFLVGCYLVLKPAETKCYSPKCVPYDGYNSEGPDTMSKIHVPGESDPIGSKNTPETKISAVPSAPAKLAQTRVPLEAHLMSKCPDAQECLQELVLPAMEQISDMVDFQLSFIASVSKKSHEIECKHGPAECVGDMLILCAANLPFPPTADDSLLPSQYPRTPVIRSLGFANCLINDFPQIPEREYVRQCALEHGIDFDALNRCASQQDDDPNGGEKPPLSGLALLRENALRGEKLGVKISCTVRLDETVWCVRDGGEWTDCAKDGEGSKPLVLIDEVKKLWKERN
ncbi:Gamma interferon inducible lysosomal thiol reductase GILT [Penicillium alfredii]|uniref:Gamma interferon inducible lysosomal thiol reductase GILT n=1 Tax=Penicillium alfredii TaxID=1506179 RepID=A0A9W9KEG3_9EURO|nr:Gamma interferon inducible lysosomal thiol reductase GILT [Penicillium alfredii]KAJ5102032.1 Gamma interferon inducible lysosomal thiol reductase GILT [Penicillium alfredii]